MPGHLTVRRYESPDADAVWRVHAAAFRASPITFVADAPADEPLRAVEEHYLEAGGEFLVCELDPERGDGDDGGEVVAVGGFLPVDGDPDLDGAPEPVAELRHVRVHPEYQRRGYGSELVAALEQRAREAGFAAVELETVEQLEAALALYRHLGYEVVERDVHPETGDEQLRLRREL